MAEGPVMNFNRIGPRPGTLVTPTKPSIWLYKCAINGIIDTKVLCKGNPVLVVGLDNESEYLVVKLLDSDGTVWSAFFNLITTDVNDWLRAP